MGQLPRVVRGKKDSDVDLSRALVPVFGIRWPSDAARRVGGRRPGAILVLLRDPKLTPANYDRISQLWADACLNDCHIPPNAWGSRFSVRGRFDMDDATPIRDWVRQPRRFLDQGAPGLCAIAPTSSAHLKRLVDDENPSELIIRERKADVLICDDPPAGEVPALEPVDSDSADPIASIRGEGFATCGPVLSSAERAEIVSDAKPGSQDESSSRE